MRHFCEDSRLGAESRAFVVVDGPAMDHVTCAALESLLPRSPTGPGGHSWSDFGVGNPVHALSRAVTIFEPAGPTALPIKPGVRSISGGWRGAPESLDFLPPRGPRSTCARSSEMVEGTFFSSVEFCRKKGRGRERGRHGWVRGGPAPRHWFSSRRTAGRGRLSILGFLKAVDSHLGIRSAPTARPPTPTSLFPGDYRLYPLGAAARAVAPHALRVVSTAGPGPRSEAGAS